MIAVIDASVIVKWFFPEPQREQHSEQALSILEAIREGKVEPLQPPHWLAEVIAVISRLEPEMAPESIDLLGAMEFSILDDLTIYKRAAEIAVHLDQHLFDTLYHAVAAEHDTVLFTADQRYYRMGRQIGHIALLSDWDPDWAR